MVVLPRLIRAYHRFLWAAFHGKYALGRGGGAGGEDLEEIPPLAVMCSKEDNLVGGGNPAAKAKAKAMAKAKAKK